MSNKSKEEILWQPQNQSAIKKQVREFADFYLHHGQIRNYVLVVLGVYTALLRLKWDDVYDFDNKHVLNSITITEKKTGKVKTFALNKDIVRAIIL
ncbi:MAG: hypothetical protein LBM93_01565 [Oscillospiraceae bacterium]|jgi:hypothetical protein|nr:hypothetical protein [Oscillospiraceae bacterium]